MRSLGFVITLSFLTFSLFSPLIANSAVKPKVLEGTVYPLVANMHFETPSLKGYTSSLGKFKYIYGENVTLSHAGIVFASIPAAPIITPLYLDDKTIAFNQLHMLKALDTSSTIAGIQLPKLAKTLSAQADFTNTESVSAALTSLRPNASLQTTVTTADIKLLSNIEAALAKTIARYQASTYISYDVIDRLGKVRPAALTPAVVKNASVTFSTPFSIQKGVVVLAKNTTFSAQLDLTLIDDSNHHFNFTSAKGNVNINGVDLHYEFMRELSSPASSRIINLVLYNGVDYIHSDYLQQIYLRNPSIPNLPPYTGWSTEVAIPISVNGFTTYHLCYSCRNHLGRDDPDGNVRNDSGHILWEVKLGDNIVQTGSSDYIQFQRFPGQVLTLTQTVIDDEGLAATKQITIGKPMTLNEAIGLFSKKVWRESPSDPDYDYYYHLTDNNTKIVEFEVMKNGNQILDCSNSGKVAVNSLESKLKHIFFITPNQFVYEGPDSESLNVTVTLTYSQSTLPSGCH
ncbi:MAG: hypothetical protein HOP21_09245 [Methylotenera sp.]|nr:hypothetical protein [Methylotenera sp.]